MLKLETIIERSENKNKEQMIYEEKPRHLDTYIVRKDKKQAQI